MKKSLKPSPPMALSKKADEVVATEARAPLSLEHIRSDSLRARVDAVRTISELESWRDEIEATIAFLKAQKK